MRRVCLAALLLLLPLAASAELSVSLDAQTMYAGNTLHISVTGAEEVTYSLLRDGKTIFESDPSAETSGAYRPTEAGAYTLTVKAENESVTRDFTVLDALSCAVSCDKESARAGEPVTVTVEGGDGAYTYAYSVYMDGERLRYTESALPSFTYTPDQAGQLRIEASLKDAAGNRAQSSVEILVLEGEKLSVSGDRSLFFSRGGARAWTVHAPGAWRAVTKDDFITLNQDCGVEGEALIFTVAQSAGASRAGTITILCGGESEDFTVSQSARDAEDEEVWLFTDASDAILVDGGEYAVWSHAEGTREFAVAASGEWTAESDVDFIEIEAADALLRLTVSDNTADAPREGAITLTCGTKTASVYITQYPQMRGGEIKKIELSSAAGKAYLDTLTARVLTGADAQSLSVEGDAYPQALTFDLTHSAPVDNGRLWTIEIPLYGEGGKQLLLLRADGGRAACAEITVEGEKAGFAGDQARYILRGGRTYITFRAAAITESVDALDAAGNLLSAFERASSTIDRYIDAQNIGRYAEWTVETDSSALPARLRIGDQEIGVLPAAPEKYAIYNQCDGSWASKKYRDSTLDHSGCAIFALSHALSALGYQGEEISPEALAKKYAFCLVDGGTLNSTLVGHAGGDLGFKTRYELYKDKNKVIEKFALGAVFTFGVVSGHIAMTDRMSDDQTMFHIVDSALSATFTRISGAQMYIQSESGAFMPVSDLSEIPGAVYYIDTNAYSGGEYWLEAGYVLGRGVRLVQPE